MKIFCECYSIDSSELNQKIQRAMAHLESIQSQKLDTGIHFAKDNSGFTVSVDNVGNRIVHLDQPFAKGGQKRVDLALYPNGEVCARRYVNGITPPFLTREIQVMEAISKKPHPALQIAYAAFAGINPQGLQVTEIFEPLYTCDLVHLIDDDKFQFTDAQIKITLSQVASGLLWLHELGFLHRDVKPDNILVQLAPDIVKAALTDYEFTDRKESTTYQGTWQYCSPEFWQYAVSGSTLKPLLIEERRQKAMTPALDVWALGMTIHLMIMLTFPSFIPEEKVCSENLLGQVTTHLHGISDTTFHSYFPDVPAHWIAIMRGCLQFEPSSRMTLSALQEKLQTIPDDV